MDGKKEAKKKGHPPFWTPSTQKQKTLENFSKPGPSLECVNRAHSEEHMKALKFTFP